MDEKEYDALKTALEAKGIFSKWNGRTQKFTTERDSLTRYPEEHRKLLLGLDAKNLRRKL
jgi:hypothetical protein